VVGLEKRPSLSQFDPNRRRGTVWGDEGKAAGCCLVADGFAVLRAFSLDRWPQPGKRELPCVTR